MSDAPTPRERASSESQAAVDELVVLLDLETIDADLYRGRSAETIRPRVYGGQVAAQALCAAIRTAGDGYQVHSLHSYFLLPGDPEVPIIYDVERIRDGRSFQTRRVSARQHGRPIYFLTASFQRPERGYEHQDAMPEVIAPSQARSLPDLLAPYANEDAGEFFKEWAGLECRWIGSSQEGLDPDPDHPARARWWMRVKGELSDDPVEHLAAFTFASDLWLLSSTLTAHDVKADAAQMASLDHTIWFHRPFRADEWWLYDQWSPSAQSARGLAIGRIFTQSGSLVATVAQEGLVRPIASK